MEDINYGFRLLLMVLIVGVNGFFAASETALVSVRVSRLKELAGQGAVGAQAALSLLANPERLLSVVQVGVTLTSLALGWVGEETLYALLLGAFAPLINPFTETVFRIAALIFAFTLMTFVHVVLGEVVPKYVAIDKSDRLALLAAPVLLVFYKITEPFVWAIERTASAIASWIGVRVTAHGAGHSAEELKFIAASSHAAGQLSDFENEAIQNLVELQNYVVREVMVPRNLLVMIPATAEIDEVLSIVSESGYSRLPVYGRDRENVLGIVHVKDVLEFWTRRRLSNARRRSVEQFDLSSIIRTVPFVPETKPVLQLLDDLRAQRAHVAFVVDEFGTITGLVSMEDVIEQVFGEIEDEFDQHIPLPSPTAGTIELAGTMPIRDLDTQYGIALPSDLDFETLAGFLLYRFARIPKAGDAFVFEGRNYTVAAMDFNRIASVRIDRMPEPAAPPPTLSDTTA